jgi:phosphotransferase system HPr-like phosphotransfer protein
MRPVARFVDLAKQFGSHIRVRKGNYIANGKDSMAMMLLEATQGTELELLADDVINYLWFWDIQQLSEI